ncbi:MAG: tetratricopeptide repeat-containing sulfotransferase family protein [Steroidobacteraceae bacterium]
MDRAWAKLRRRDYAAAHTAIGELRTQYPGNRDVLLLLAVSLRHLDRIPEALEVLAELERHHPAYARLFEERGLCHLARQAIEPAVTALSQAVTLNPWLPETLRALASLHRMRGRPKEAEAAARAGAVLEQLPRPLVTAHSMFADGEIRAAEQLVRRYLQTHGAHIEGLRLLARIAMMHDVARDAEILLADVLRMAPDYHAARYEYALALLAQLKHLRAREELEKLRAAEPENRDYRIAHATACARLGDHGQALPAYQALLRQTPQDPELHLAIGHELTILGRTAEAIRSYRAAAAVRPGYANACWQLANLKTYRFEDAELEQMTRYEADAETTFVDRYQLCFALGKAREDRGEYALSFHYYERGNALKKGACRYRPEFLENIARLQVATCTPDFFAARQGWGYPDAAPIFIVGLPRAGSTLIEQILASHSQVDGTMELPNIPHLVLQLHDHTRPPDDPRYPGVLAQLTREDCARLGEQYIRDTRVYRHGKPFFIDKWPDNFHNLGLIHLILPNARIIDARREPMACCFGIFKQLFPSGAGPEFAYSFEDIARYYRIYRELMRHWEPVLPGKILRIQHEELVMYFSATVHRLVEFCGLQPQPACFEFHKTKRAIYTPSAAQVRQPINRAGLDQWRHFEPWLAPLKEALLRFDVISRDTPACGR